MNTFTNFVLNTFASILSHATSAPNVEQIHTLVDRFHNRSNESTNNNNNPPRQESSVYDNMLSQSLADANSNDSDNDSYHSAIEHEDSDISNDGFVNNNANAAMTSNSVGSYHGNQSARKNNHQNSEDDTYLINPISNHHKYAPSLITQYLILRMFDSPTATRSITLRVRHLRLVGQQCSMARTQTVNFPLTTKNALASFIVPRRGVSSVNVQSSQLQERRMLSHCLGR